MSDYINRQAAIDALHKKRIETMEKGQDVNHIWECLDVVAQVPSAQPDIARSIATIIENEKDMRVILASKPSAQQWIPCSERLPEEEKDTYWVCTDTGYQCQCRWTNDVYGLGASERWEWKIFDIPQYQKVIAWMPLPKPYKGEES